MSSGKNAPSSRRPSRGHHHPHPTTGWGLRGRQSSGRVVCCSICAWHGSNLAQGRLGACWSNLPRHICRVSPKEISSLASVL